MEKLHCRNYKNEHLEKLVYFQIEEGLVQVCSSSLGTCNMFALVCSSSLGVCNINLQYPYSNIVYSVAIHSAYCTNTDWMKGSLLYYSLYASSFSYTKLHGYYTCT